MKIKVTKDLCEIKENEIWNVGDYNVHTVQVELSPEFNGLVNKVRYFVEDNSYDMLITDNVAQVPYEATVMEGTIKIGVYGYDADTDILVQSTSPVNKYITSGTYTGDPDNTQPLTPTDKEQMETAIQKNTNDITDLKENKQDKLISGVNIKTINKESILSSGNLTLVTEETDPIFTNSPAYSITDNDITYWNNKANMSDIPDVSNFITKNVNDLTYYTKSTDMQTAINNAVGNERTARENADNSLQNQIDAITVSSDVVDVVSTYQDLVDYDTQHIKANDIIKVMQDSTHDNAISYYRWVIVNHVGSWEYVGSEGPYYTKSETDTLLNAKQNTLVSGQNIKTINNESLLGEGNINIQSGGTSDYTDLTNKPKINNVELVGNKTLNDLGIQPVGNYALESDMTEAQNDIDHLSKVSNLFEKITGTGTSVTLNDTSNTIMKLNLDTTTSSQEDTPTPDSPQDIHTVSGDNSIKVVNKNFAYLKDGTYTKENDTAIINNNLITLNTSSSTGSNSYFSFGNGYTQTWAPTGEGIKNVNDLKLTGDGGNYIATIYTNKTIPGSISFRIYTSNNRELMTSIGGYMTSTINISLEDGEHIKDYGLWSGTTAIFNDYQIRVQLEKGSTATEYQPHQEQTYPINLGSMELCKIGDYKDILFKNTMDSEYYNSSLELNKWYKLNNIGKVVLDGSENWNVSNTDTPNYIYYAYINNFKPLTTGGYSNYYTFISIGGSDTNQGIFAVNDYVRIRYGTEDTVANFKTWLSSHNVELYYVLKTPTYTLLNDTLQTQLDNLQYALAYDTQTNISQTNTDLPFIIDAETYVDLTDYVKNTDYATNNKGGVIKTGYGSNVDSNGNLYASNFSYANYQTAGNNNFISKGTLENVITGKELITSSYHDSTKQNVTDESLNTVNKNIVPAINEVDSIAKGANQALSYGNYSAMVTAFNSLANNVYNVGQNVMIITLQVPDLWISGIESTSSTYTYTTDEAITTALSTNGYIQVGYYKLSALETQKVDLTDYATKTYVNNLFNSIVDGDEVSY